MIEHLIPILVGTLAAATPLIFAGLGELVAERTGVINLGVEGMMLVGAIAGFAAAAETGYGAARRFACRGGCRCPDGADLRHLRPVAGGQSGGLRSGADDLRRRSFRRS